MTSSSSSVSDDPSFALLNDIQKISSATDTELSTAISQILSIVSALQRQQQGSSSPFINNMPIAFPTVNLPIVHCLIQRCLTDASSTMSNNKNSSKNMNMMMIMANAAKSNSSNNNSSNNSSSTTSKETIIDHFCNQQLKVLIATYFATAAKNAGYQINEWFDDEDDEDENEYINEIRRPTRSLLTVNSLIPILLKALTKEAHSLVAGEILRLFLHFSPVFLQAFVFYYDSTSTVIIKKNSNSNNIVGSGHHQDVNKKDDNHQTGTLLFENTSFGLLGSLLTDTATALRNHAAWQVLYAVLQTDLETLRPSREIVVSYLANNHLHSFMNLLVSCLRHAHPASRRFTLRLISDILQLFSDWNPISHCILQSPAIFFALLANTEGPPCAEHWQVYHILKMFIMFPKKCPLMRHLCYINRDALGQYAQSCASKFSGHPKETSMIMSKLSSMTPLTAEEAALIQCSSSS